MAWTGWIIVIVTIAAIGGYRYAFGKWPVRFDL